MSYRRRCRNRPFQATSPTQHCCEPCWDSDAAPTVQQPLTEMGERLQELQKQNKQLKQDIKAISSQIKRMEKQ
jgi:hypothetical protein